MSNELFDPVEEMESLREYDLLTTRNFMVAVFDLQICPYLGLA